MTQAEKDARIEQNLAFIKEQSESLRDNPPTGPIEALTIGLSIVMAASDCELIAGSPSDEKLKEWGARPARLNTHESGGLKRN
jgi:hypothetical protein